MVDRKLRDIDQTKHIIEYLEKNIKKGYKLEDLKWALINQGNSKLAVQKAVDFVLKQNKEPVVQAPEPTKQYEQEKYVDLTPASEEKSFWQKFRGFFS